MVNGIGSVISTSLVEHGDGLRLVTTADVLGEIRDGAGELTIVGPVVSHHLSVSDGDLDGIRWSSINTHAPSDFVSWAAQFLCLDCE